VTGNHIIYIPMMLMVGGFIGFIVGARAARNAYDLQRRRDAERDKAKAERAARKAAAAEKAAGAGDD
jgi:hypothetical protein